MNVLFLIGIPDDGRTRYGLVDGRLRNILHGSSNVVRFLKNDINHCEISYIAGLGPDQHISYDAIPDLVFNEITDPDSHNAALNRCHRFTKALGVPVVNAAQEIAKSRRDHAVKLLGNIDNLLVPKTIRVEPGSPQDVRNAIKESSLSFPIIFRQAGDHGGKSTVILENFKAIDKAMYAFALDGRAYYLTQFIDFADSDGLYRKSRLVVIGSEVILRHQITSDNWLIHSKSREYMEKNPEYKEQERQVIESFEGLLEPKILPIINQINQKLGLDYYGIDCHISEEGEILLFELNANMNILINNAPTPNIWEEQIDKIRTSLIRLCKSRSGMEAK